MSWRYKYIMKPLFIVLDIMIISTSYGLAYSVRYGHNIGFTEFLPILFVISFLWVIVNPILKLNDEPRYDRSSWRPLNYLLGQLIIIGTLASFLVFGDIDTISRLFLAYFIILQFCLLVLIRIFRHRFVKLLRTRGLNTKPLYLIGSDSDFFALSDWLSANPWSGFRFGKAEFFNAGPKNQYSNCLEWVEKTFKDKSGESLIIAEKSQSTSGEINDIIDISEEYGIRVNIIHPLYYPIRKYRNGKRIGPFPVLSVREEPLLRKGSIIIKRLFDILFSGTFILFVFWWYFLLVGLFIKINSRGPILFKQKRVGKNRKIFGCYKFRTMVHNTIAENGFGDITSKIDGRVTKVGTFLRKTNIDEIPQFINVFLGEMSIVGPRPHMIKEDFTVEKRVKHYRLRQRVKPGITGLAGIKGFRGGTDDMVLMQKRIDYDIEYIEKWSFGKDLKIIWTTTKQMLRLDTGAH